MCPDLTTKERELNKKLWDELKHRKDNGEKNLMIKCGQIVVCRASSSPESRPTSN